MTQVYDALPPSAFIKPTPYVAGGRGGLRAEIMLSPDVLHVSPGTIIKPSPTGWVVAPDGHGEMVCGKSGYGGEMVESYRQAIIEFPPAPASPRPKPYYGRLRIDSTEDNGYVHLVPDDFGPLIALGSTTVLFDLSAPWPERRAEKAKAKD